jgi:LEA14-like dessication related protein
MFLYDTGSPYTTVTNITCNETCMTNFYNPNASSSAVQGESMDLMVNGVNMTGYLYTDAICLNST